MGRSYEYKSDASSVYIGDLKVPKKYITISTGPNQLEDINKTTLQIRFDSICTTTVNGKVYKLPTRESAPITEEFQDEVLVLKVNANKSDRIQLHLKWQPVTVLAFAKRIQFDGDIHPSPLPGILEGLHSQGIDLRSTRDPTLATHYLAMSDFVDHNLKIVVLRGVPVVSTRWTDYLEKNADDVASWLDPLPSLLLPGTDHNYVFPDRRRSLLLKGYTSVICHEGALLKHTQRLQTWLDCLGSKRVVQFELNRSAIEARDLVAELGSGPTLIFSIDEDKTSADAHFGLQINTFSELWKAVADVDLHNMKVFDVSKFGADSITDDALPLKEQEVEVKQETQNVPLTQRRKRRKVERVKDTDFFLFSQNAPSSTPAAESLVIPEVGEGNQANAEHNNVTTSSNSNREVTPDEQSTTRATDDSLPHVTASEGSINSQETSDTTLQERKDEIADQTTDMEPKFKKIRPGPDGEWIVPQISLADAIKSTKKQADDEVKKELGYDDLDTNLTNLAIVEEVDLLRKAPTVAAESRNFAGRKNFKAFRKNGRPTNNVTRTFLELHDDNSANEIHFTDHRTEQLHNNEVEKVKLDFAKEMSSVKGYQPQASQLFVGEISSDEDVGETTFSFLSATKKTARKQHLDSDEDDEFAFKFTRA